MEAGLKNKIQPEQSLLPHLKLLCRRLLAQKEAATLHWRDSSPSGVPQRWAAV